jgi:hypothetical protein
LSASCCARRESEERLPRDVDLEMTLDARTLRPRFAPFLHASEDAAPQPAPGGAEQPGGVGDGTSPCVKLPPELGIPLSGWVSDVPCLAYRMYI